MRRQITTKLLIGILLIIAAGMASSTELLLDISYIKSSKGLQVNGTTNVPNGTKIGIALEGNGYRAQDFDVFVKGGKYASGYFTNKGQKPAGSFQISVFIYENKIWQKKPEILKALSSYESDLLRPMV